MKLPDHPLPPHDAAWADVRLEAYLDGLLDDADVDRLERELAATPALRRALGCAERVQDELRLMPQPLAPPTFALGVFAELERRRSASPIGRLRRLFAETYAAAVDVWRPALAATTLLLLVMAGAFLGRPTPAPPPESAEVRQAMDEVKWALAYLSEVGRQAGEVVREDVLENHVVRPVQTALGTFLEEPSSAQPSTDAVR